MSDTPTFVHDSFLWKSISKHELLLNALKTLRHNAESIGNKIAEVIPDFTDHSVIHMDALWGVAEHVFTSEEKDKFTDSEAFILACSFYTHDLGMAIGITEEGRKQLSESDAYITALAHLQQSKGITLDVAKVSVLKTAARDLHAKNAEVLIDSPLPGLEKHLIENTEVRAQWGNYIGRISSSHHWNLAQVEKELGNRGRVPDPLGDTLDLGLVACALRIIDYSHINFQRAASLDRVLRYSIAPDSLIHWKAQENITGPHREGNSLVYGSNRPLADVDAWWLFYEMATGLDREIATVGDYLSRRSVSTDRFSLEGVKGVKTPQTFATLVETQGFEPVDVRFRSDAMDRLINLLGGRSLYGDDYLAPLRELLQNARDSILLRQAVERASGYGEERGEVHIKVESSESASVLTVADNGVGMNAPIITNYLLGVAADYWNSSDFFANYPGVQTAGFKPTRKFGIGFLSVFMLGDKVEVKSQVAGGQKLTLRLHGLGKRGSLVTQPPRMKPGTTIRVEISPVNLQSFDKLTNSVRLKAPMLTVPVTVTERETSTVIEPGWWKNISQEEFSEFVFTEYAPIQDVSHNIRATTRRLRSYKIADDKTLEEVPELSKWPGLQPEIINDKARVIALPGSSRVKLCSKGFAIRTLSLNGFFGIIELDNIELNAARNQVLDYDVPSLRAQLLRDLRPSIMESLQKIKNERNIPSRYSFLVDIANSFGCDLLIDCEIPWISILEPPGRCDLITAAQLRSCLEQSKDVVLAYGDKVNAWTVDRAAQNFFPERSQNALVLPIPNINQPTPRTNYDFDQKNGPQRGSLSDVLFSEDDNGYATGLKTINELIRVPFLYVLLEYIAKCWDMDPMTLYNQKWVRDRANIYGLIARL